jgi:hypothetical protein
MLISVVPSSLDMHKGCVERVANAGTGTRSEGDQESPQASERTRPASRTPDKDRRIHERLTGGVWFMIPKPSVLPLRMCSG